jgi:chorismate mutase
MPELPLLCDPSHIAGQADLVSSVAHAAMMLYFDGLMVEVHPSPADALTDAHQQLTPGQLLAMIKELSHKVERNDTDATGNVAMLREKIDEVDNELLQLLSRRMGLSRQMAEVKRSQQMSVYQPKRWDELLYDRMAKADTLALDKEFIKEIFEKIHGESVRVQMGG